MFNFNLYLASFKFNCLILQQQNQPFIPFVVEDITQT